MSAIILLPKYSFSLFFICGKLKLFWMVVFHQLIFHQINEVCYGCLFVECKLGWELSLYSFSLLAFLQMDCNLKFVGISLSTCLVDNVPLLTVMLSFLSWLALLIPALPFSHNTTLSSPSLTSPLHMGQTLFMTLKNNSEKGISFSRP